MQGLVHAMLKFSANEIHPQPQVLCDSNERILEAEACFPPDLSPGTFTLLLTVLGIFLL